MFSLLLNAEDTKKHRLYRIALIAALAVAGRSLHSTAKQNYDIDSISSTNKEAHIRGNFHYINIDRRVCVCVRACEIIVMALAVRAMKYKNTTRINDTQHCDKREIPQEL